MNGSRTSMVFPALRQQVGLIAREEPDQGPAEATLRERRHAPFPRPPLGAGSSALASATEFVTVHPRVPRRSRWGPIAARWSPARTSRAGRPRRRCRTAGPGPRPATSRACASPGAYLEASRPPATGKPQACDSAVTVFPPCLGAFRPVQARPTRSLSCLIAPARRSVRIPPFPPPPPHPRDP